MEILDTLIRREIETISKQGQPTIAFRWRLILKVAGVEIKPLYILETRLDRLYVKNFADELQISAAFTHLDYQQYIMPNRDSIEATLMRVPLHSETNGEIDYNKAVTTNTYKAQLFETESQAISGNTPLALSKGAGKSMVKNLTIQLFNPVIDHLRKQTFGTVFRDVRAIDAMTYVLWKIGRPETADISVNVEGINITPGYDERVRTQVIVPHLTKLIHIPGRINEIVGGIYPTGFHYYLQSRYWYLYPTFDVKRYETADRVLTLIKIPKHRMLNVEKTYRVTTNQVIVLTTRESKHKDTSEAEQLNKGNGVRFTDATRIMDDFYTTTDNKAVAQVNRNLTEVMLEKRSDGEDMVVGASTAITDKYNLEYSEIARKSGSIIQCVWENCNVELLEPGMAVKYIFMDGETPREMYGVLNAVEEMSYQQNINIGEQRFTSIALVTIFVGRSDPMKRETLGGVINSKLVSN